jgi:hypothetical protein
MSESVEDRGDANRFREEDATLLIGFYSSSLSFGIDSPNGSKEAQWFRIGNKLCSW